MKDDFSQSAPGEGAAPEEPPTVRGRDESALPPQFEALDPRETIYPPEGALRRLPFPAAYPVLPERRAVKSKEAAEDEEPRPTSSDETLVDSLLRGRPFADEKSGFDVESSPVIAHTSPFPFPVSKEGDADFILQRRLGKGGQGEVWLAKQPSLDREVAVKVLKAAKGREAVLGFLQEAFTAAELDHPNIIPIYELSRCTVDDRQCHMLAMKLVRGRAWDAILTEDRKNEALTDEQFFLKHLGILLQVCNAVSYAHSKRIIHRDLKPRQVAIGTFGEVYLLDWGLALSLDQEVPQVSSGEWPKYRTLETASNNTGTPAYMAPEQTFGAADRLGVNTDIYLLGAILFEIVAGRPPHSANTAVEAYAMAVRNECHPVPPECPEELREIVQRAMATRAADRFLTAMEFRDAVQNYLTGANRERESRDVSRIAARDAAMLCIESDYAHFEHVLRELARAILLWPRNEEASSLRQQVLTIQARRAVRLGDLQLARTMCATIEDEAIRRTLLNEITNAERETTRHAMQRRVLFGATAVLCIGMMVALWVVRRHVLERENADARATAQAAQVRQERAERALAQATAREELARRELTEQRAADSERLALLFQRLALLRTEETVLSNRLRGVYPLPSRLERSEQRSRGAAGIDLNPGRLRQRISELRGERAALSAEPIVGGSLSTESLELLIGEATLELEETDTIEGALHAYEMFTRARELHDTDPRPITGMGIAAYRAGYPTSATLHLSEASLRTAGLYGRTHPDYAVALALEGEAHQGFDEKNPDFIARYRESVELLEDIWSDLSLTLANRWTALGDYDRALSYSSPTLPLRERIHGEAESEAATAMDSIAATLLSRGNYKEAEPLQRRALEIRLRVHGEFSEEVAATYGNLSVSLKMLGRYEDAELLAMRALAIREELLGPEHTSVAYALINVAQLYSTQGRLAEAESHYRRALRIRQEQLGADHPLTIEALSAVASSIGERGQYAEAEKLLREVLDLTIHRLGERHPETARTYNNLASNLSEQSRYEEAVTFYLRAYELAAQVLGGDHPDTLSAVNNLGVSMDNLGRHQEAEVYLRRTHDTRLRLYGPDHPTVAAAKINLVGCLNQLGRYAEAEPISRDALRIYREVHGEQSPQVATAKITLSQVLESRGRYEEALLFLDEALKVRRNLFGDAHPDTLTAMKNMAGLLDNMGRFRDSELLYKEALAARRQVLGEQHFDTASTLHDLAANYLRQNRPDDAEGLLREAIAAFERTVGADHPSTANAYNSLANVFFLRGQPQEAESSLRKHLDSCAATYGEEHPHTALAMGNLARVLHSLEQLEEAEELYRHSLEIRRKVLDEDHPDIPRLLANLAAIVDERGRRDEAEPILREAAAMAERVQGPASIDLARILETLGEFCEADGNLAEADQHYSRSLQIRNRIYTLDHPETAYAAFLRGRVARKLGNTDDAAAGIIPALRVFETRMGTAHPLTGMALDEFVRIQEMALASQHPELGHPERTIVACVLLERRYLGQPRVAYEQLWHEPESAGWIALEPPLFKALLSLPEARADLGERCLRRALGMVELVGMGKEHPLRAGEFFRQARALHMEDAILTIPTPSQQRVEGQRSLPLSDILQYLDSLAQPINWEAEFPDFQWSVESVLVDAERWRGRLQEKVHREASDTAPTPGPTSNDLIKDAP